MSEDAFASDTGAAARYYATELGWPVAQGTWLRGPGRCSCGEQACPRPGGHPLASAWWLEASSNLELVRELWEVRPEASVLVPTGVGFDVLDVPAAPGREAVHRLREMGYRPGPVAVTDEGRMLLFVRVHTRDAQPWAEAGRWPFGALDLYRQSEGAYVALPPSAGLRWVVDPATTRGVLPAVDEIIGTVASVCRELGLRTLPANRPAVAPVP